MSSSPRLKFIEGAIDTIPLMIGAIPFGIIYGTLSQSSDLSVYGALALSSIVFAGSSQFVALGLIATLIVFALSCAEIPVVTPVFDSMEIVKAV